MAPSAHNIDAVSIAMRRGRIGHISDEPQNTLHGLAEGVRGQTEFNYG